ncbi:MAG: hypothetical protein NUW01_08795 [Gemmatimonadaceae bacterium]|nr:hypothetical protein [Gemmatimonadaceae bacterium]
MTPETPNALLAEARAKPLSVFHHGYFPDVADDLISRLADALEASQAREESYVDSLTQMAVEHSEQLRTIESTVTRLQGELEIERAECARRGLESQVRVAALVAEVQEQPYTWDGRFSWGPLELPVLTLREHIRQRKLAEAQVAQEQEQAHTYLEEATRLMAHLQRFYDATDDPDRKAEIESAIIGDEWPPDKRLEAAEAQVAVLKRELEELRK